MISKRVFNENGVNLQDIIEKFLVNFYFEFMSDNIYKSF